MHPEIDPLVEEEIKVEIGEVIIIEAITETDQEADGTITGQVIGVTNTRLTIDEVILDQIMDKTPNGCLETEVKVAIEMEITTMTIREAEIEIEIITGPFNQDKVHYLMGGTNLGPGPTLG